MRLQTGMQDCTSDRVDQSQAEDIVHLRCHGNHVGVEVLVHHLARSERATNQVDRLAKGALGDRRDDLGGLQGEGPRGLHLAKGLVLYDRQLEAKYHMHFALAENIPNAQCNTNI